MSATEAVSAVRSRLSLQLPRERSERVAAFALLALVGAGAALRLTLMVAWRPAFIGYPDSGIYIGAARGDLFNDPLRPVGYPLFLRGLHALTANLSLTMVVQHALGIVSALLLYAAVRRAGFARLVALVPAAVVLLNGSQVFLEHAPLSEVLFIFLLAASIYAAARLIERSCAPWAAAAGLCAAFAGTARLVGFLVVPVYVVWIGLWGMAAWRRRLMHAAVCAVVAGAVLGAYVFAQHEANGYTGLTRSGAWNLYGRAAVFADCTKFSPPAGTRSVCERTPASKRMAPSGYMLDTTRSPGMRALRGPFLGSSDDNRKIAAFARAAILGQPLDYLETVAKGMLEYVAPAGSAEHEGSSYADFFHRELFDPTWSERVRGFALSWYGAAARGVHVNLPLLNKLLRYETVTQLKGPLFLVLAFLSLISPLLARGRYRRAALLFAAVAWLSLVAPVATLGWAARYAVPAFGPLAASAAIGGWALWPTLSRLPAVPSRYT